MMQKQIDQLEHIVSVVNKLNADAMTFQQKMYDKCIEIDDRVRDAVVKLDGLEAEIYGRERNGNQNQGIKARVGRVEGWLSRLLLVMVVVASFYAATHPEDFSRVLKVFGI